MLIESEENVINHGLQQLSTGMCNIQEILHALGESYTFIAYTAFS